MQLLADGGFIYSTSDGYDSTISFNHLSGDPVQYGGIYHDGGSSNWHDTRNVIENVRSACIFTHGSCPNISESYSWCAVCHDRPNGPAAASRSAALPPPPQGESTPAAMPFGDDGLLTLKWPPPPPPAARTHGTTGATTPPLQTSRGKLAPSRATSWCSTARTGAPGRRRRSASSTAPAHARAGPSARPLQPRCHRLRAAPPPRPHPRPRRHRRRRHRRRRRPQAPSTSDCHRRRAAATAR
jgi:hypothetical protein